jgi:hypothetical protein
LDGGRRRDRGLLIPIPGRRARASARLVARRCALGGGGHLAPPTSPHTTCTGSGPARGGTTRRIEGSAAYARPRLGQRPSPLLRGYPCRRGPPAPSPRCGFRIRVGLGLRNSTKEISRISLDPISRSRLCNVSVAGISHGAAPPTGRWSQWGRWGRRCGGRGGGKKTLRCRIGIRIKKFRPRESALILDLNLNPAPAHFPSSR